MPLEYHRLLQTVVNANAVEAWLVTGRPPLLRVNGAFRPLDLPPLTTEEIESIVLKIDEPGRNFYRANGVADFPVTLGENRAQFHCSIVKSEQSAFLLIRHLMRPASPAAAPTPAPAS